MREQLPRTFVPFLGQFARSTAIQREGIPPILAGRDVLLSAPTAAGKTEAYAAPVAERLLAGARGPFSALIVSPTRALANDLHRRLQARMGAVGLDFGRHTGEHKETVRGRRPEVAVTTPEALDSLLARRPGELAGVKAVVLDEIHVLDGTVRGDQLRILLFRLDRAAVARPQRIAASATVADPGALAARYLENAVVATHRAARPIRAKGFAGRDRESLARHLDALGAAGFRKILAFCDRREDVERHATEMVGRTSFGERVFAHHGSLARSVRERHERRFLEAPAAVAFATLTLELGIDIGTVDYVLLMTPPRGVASLLQRIGRGSRRTDSSRVGYVYETEAERHVHRALLSLAGKGDLAEDRYSFRPSVLVQQALAIAGGAGWVSSRRLAAVLPPEIARTPAGRAPARVLDAAVDAGLLEPPRGGRHVLTERTERAWRRGVLHSSFEAPPEKDVIDRMTGEVIGRAAFEESPRRVNLGGRSRRVVLEDDARILVDSGRGSRAPKFAARGHASLPHRTARALAERFGSGPGELLQVPHPAGALVLHGTGDAGALLLAHVLSGALGPGAVVHAGPMILVLRRELTESPRPAPEAIERLLADREPGLAHAVGMGRFHGVLPPDLRSDATRRAANLDEIAAFLRNATLVTREDPAPDWWRDL